MKFKNLIMLSILAILFIPVSVFASKCEAYSVDKCPASICTVKNGACTEVHIGDDFCRQEKVMGALKVTGYFLFLVRVLVPLIVIVFGTFDLFKAVTGGDSKSLGSSAKKLGIRVLIGFSIFLLPTLIHIILSTLNDYNAISDDANVCQTCLLKPSACEDGVPEDQNPFDDPVFVQPDSEEEDDGDDEIVIEG